MDEFFIKNLSDVYIDKLRSSEQVIACLDIGDKTIGISISDRNIKIAGGIKSILRDGSGRDFKRVAEALKEYRVGLIIFGWPVQMNGTTGAQCEKVLEFIKILSGYIKVDYAKWDERFSTSVVDQIMIKADLSRKKRKKVIDKTAAAYILQGAIDFLNRPKILQ